MYVGVRVKCLIFLSDFNKTVIFFPDFTRNPQHKVSRKSVRGEPSSDLRKSSNPRRLLDCRRWEPVDRAETSVSKQLRPTLRNIPEERKPQQHRDRSLSREPSRSMRMDGQTDMTKLIIISWNCFVNAPRKFLLQNRLRHREHNQVAVFVMATRVTTHTKGRCHCKRCHMRESKNLIITA